LLRLLQEREVRDDLERFEPLWNELFPAEQARIVQLLVERVDVSNDGIDISLRTEGLSDLVKDLRDVNAARRVA
jgi:site-specific DNA recombinase